MRGSVSGGFLLLLALCCSFAHAYIYNYCQAPLPRYYAPPIGSLNLVQVSVITRHGDRSPAVTLPVEGVEWVCGATDDLEIEADGLPTVGPVYRNIFIDPSSPFSSNLWSGNCTVGQLTSKGATQHYLLGQQLRSIYISTLRFIPPTFDPTLLFIRSTDVWRTQQSAEANLLGLYPVSTRNGIVPMVNITPSNIENMFGNLGACPILVEAATNLTQQPEYLTHLDAFEPVLTKLNTICNTTDYYGANSSWTTLDFWDNLQARTCHNLPLPCSGGVCVNKTDMAALLKEGNFEFTWLNSGPYLTRLGIGLFVTQVLNHISSVLNGTSSQRYAYYSGHDSTLAPWLNAWNITDWQWPPYASNLLMETWRSKDGANVYVRMIYNGDLMSFPYCSNPQFCTWAEIMNYYEEHIKADVSLCF